MRAAVRVWNGVGKRQNLIVIAVVILKHNVDKNFVPLARDDDRFWMNDLLVFTQLPNEFFDPVLIEKGFFFERLDAFIRQINFEAGIKKRQLAQPARQTLELKFRRDREDR